MGTEGHGFSRRPSRNFKPPVFHQLRADAHSNGHCYTYRDTNRNPVAYSYNDT